MSEQYPGGFLTSVPPTPAGPYQTSSATGLWTLSQQAAYAKLGQWPTAGNLAPIASRAFITSTNDSSSFRTEGTAGTVSGSSISLLNLGQLVSSNENVGSVGLSVCFNSVNQVFVYTYKDSTDSNKGKAVVVTPNTAFTSMSVGTAVTFDSSVIGIQMVTYIGNSKVCIIYQDDGNNDYATSIIGTVSGTSITFGSPVVIHTNPAGLRNDCIGISSDGAGGVLFAYMDGATGYGYLRAATTSGTVPTWGSAVAFESSGTARYAALAYSTSAGKYAFVYQTQSPGDADGFGRVVTVSGTTITLSSVTTYETGSVVGNGIAYDPTNNAFAVLYNDVSVGDAFVVKATMGTTLSYSARTLFRTSTGRQTTGANNVTSSVGLGKVVGVNASSTSAQSAVIDISGATPTVGTLQTVNTTAYTIPSLASSG
jgi:hypothetical protein